MKTTLINALIVCALFVSSYVFAANGSVVVLLSDDTPVYKKTMQAYIAKLDKKVTIYNIQGDINAAPQLLQEIMQQKPSLIFALGAKAAFFAKEATSLQQQTAVLFAMVINHQRYNLMSSQNNVAGIAADISAGAQLFNMSLFSSQVKRVGVIYSPEFSQARIDKAQAAAKILDLELIAQPITHEKEFRLTWLKMSPDIDAYWVLNDPVLYTLDNIYWIKIRCLKQKKFCMGQSDNITRLGVLLSVNPDYASLGDQAASLSKDILSKNVTPKEINVKDPIGTRLTINATTAKKIGLEISKAAMAVVSEVIKE